MFWKTSCLRDYISRGRRLFLMKNAENFLKANLVILTLDAILSFLLSFLVPKGVYAIAVGVLSFVLSLILLYLSQKEKKRAEERLASYSFVHQFFQGILTGLSPKGSYEVSSRYLISYQTVRDYEEERDNPTLKVEEFQEVYLTVLEKDKEDEARLLSLKQAEEAAFEREEKLASLYEEEKKKEKTFLLLLLFLLLLASMLFLFYPPLVTYRNSATEFDIKYLLPCFLTLWILPSYHGLRIYRYKEICHA